MVSERKDGAWMFISGQYPLIEEFFIWPNIYGDLRNGFVFHRECGHHLDASEFIPAGSSTTNASGKAISTASFRGAR